MTTKNNDLNIDSLTIYLHLTFQAFNLLDFANMDK